MKVCKACGHRGTGKYCSECGQSLELKRITVRTILHDAFHFFTHLDKGYPYTLKKLIRSPGKMQREYVTAKRNRHQKPFSMFFISLTVMALLFYWINSAIIKYYHAGEANEAAFFDKYMVGMVLLMLPIYSLVTYLFFYRSGYNYAEITVLVLYTFSFIFLMLVLIQTLKFIWPHMETRYIELPLVVLYTVITNANFFNSSSKAGVIIKSILVGSICFLVSTYIQDWIVEL